MTTAEEYFDKRDAEITDREIYMHHHDSTIIKLMEEYHEERLKEIRAQIEDLADEQNYNGAHDFDDGQVYAYKQVLKLLQ